MSAADNVKGGEAQGELIMKLYPDGASIINLQGQSGASPAIDRNKGLHNVLDKAGDKYKIVFEQTAGFDRSKGLSVTEAARVGNGHPAAGDRRGPRRRHGAGARWKRSRRATCRTSRSSGSTRSPRRWRRSATEGLTATIEQFPAKQSETGVKILMDFIKDGTRPAEQVTLLTPVAGDTKDNLEVGERMSEVK